MSGWARRRSRQRFLQRQDVCGSPLRMEASICGSRMAELVDRFLEAHVDGYGVSDFSAAVEALVAAGLISNEAGTSWKAEHARIRGLGAAHRGPYDPSVEAKAIELLEALFEPVRPSDSPDWDGAVFQRYQEALSTLTAIGALSYERARPWAQRQGDTLVPGGWKPPPPEPEMPFRAAELTAVVAGPALRLGGMQITSVELFDDCVIVRSHQLLPGEPDDPVERRQLLGTALELEDDQGTPYLPVAIPCAHGCKRPEIREWSEVLLGWQAFLPGAPLDARRFFITWRDERFEVVVDNAHLPDSPR